MTQAFTEEQFWTNVTKGDGCWEWTGNLWHGYGYFYWNRRTTGSHRVSYELANGAIPAGMLIDHICHNKACVNPSHLRLATPKQNVENFSGLHSHNTSGVRGVYWNKVNRRWQASVMHNGKRLHVGCFTDLNDAEAAVVTKRLELFTHNELDRVA